MDHRPRVVTLFAAFGCFSCLGGGGAHSLAPLPAGGHHVLFIGSSLTYVNDLPATVAAIAQSAGDTIRVATEAQPNLALINHLNGGTAAVDHIAMGGWEYVVLQQGPTPRGICRDSLILWTKLFDPLIRAVGAKPALLMTWPSIDQAGIFDDVRISFQMAAAAVNGVFMPAGEAWRAALRVDPSVGVYGPDGFHPSAIGTFVAALEIYERITGRDPRTLPPRAFSNGREFALPEATVRILQSAAHEANTAFPASPAVPDDPARTTGQNVGHC
jgi:hypothetical protein